MSRKNKIDAVKKVEIVEKYNNRRLQRKLHIMTPMAFHELTLKAA